MTGSSSPGPKGSSRSCCVTLPSPRLPPSPRRRRSRPQQGRQRHHRRCHHRSLRQRQSERADPLTPYLDHPLQEFQTQEGLQAEIVSTSQIRVDNRPADDPHSVARFECVLCPEQRRRSPLPLGIARQAGCNFQVVERSSKLVLAPLLLKAFASCPRHVPARREAPASLSPFLESVHFMAGHAIAREGGQPLQEIASRTRLDCVGHLIKARV